MGSWIRLLNDKVQRFLTSPITTETHETKKKVQHSMDISETLGCISTTQIERPPNPERSLLRYTAHSDESKFRYKTTSTRCSTSSEISAYFSLKSTSSYDPSPNMEELQVIARTYYSTILPLCLHYLGVLDSPPHRPYSFIELKAMLEDEIFWETDRIRHDDSLDFEEEWHNLRTNAFRTLYDISTEYMSREIKRKRRQMKCGSLKQKLAVKLMWWNDDV